MNNADTTYYIKGSDNTIDTIFNAFSGVSKNLIVQCLEACDLPISEFLDNLGINPDTIYCGGQIELFYCNGERIEICMTTNWDYLPEVVDALKKRFADDKGFQIHFACEEPCADVFLTDSKEIFKRDYVLDDEGELTSYYHENDSETAFKDLLRDLTEIAENKGITIPDNITDYDTLEEWVTNSNEMADAELTIHRYKEI